MSNDKYVPSEQKARLIREEILQKIEIYESRMTNRLARWVEAAELYCGKTQTSKDNSKNSPNSAELFKAIRAMRNMLMRMLLGNKPSFELECMDLIGYSDQKKILKAEHYVQNQLDLSNYEKGMARALDQILLYGSVACHEQYEPLRASYLGRKNYVTTFRPVSLINCAFSLDAYDITESNWVALSDIQGKYVLNKLKEHDPKGEVYNLGEINKALAQSEYTPKINTWVTQRMAYQGYINQNFVGGMERTTYYGPLDCMNDHEEYCVEIVNREFIIRMESYEGIRPVRIGIINSLDVEPLGNGMYDMFGPLLSKIDHSEHALLNMITLAGASMFTKQKSLTDEDAEFAIRQFGIMSLENPVLNSIGPDANNLQAVAGYNDVTVQRFRQASGATDTLQALVSGDQATATATSLAMNEAVRNLSVQAQILAPDLHRDHIKVVLQNAQKYNREPFVMHMGGAPVTIVPSDLMLDVNVKVKVTTDQDFRPAKLQRLREGIQLMAMFGPGAIPGKKVNPGPAIEEYLKTLDVPKYEETIQDITPEDLMAMNVQAQMQNPQQEQEEPGENEGPETGAERVNNGKPGKREARMLNRNNNMPMAEQTMKTPVGQVMTAPGDVDQSTQAIRKASGGN
jgi:hypothetical protein